MTGGAISEQAARVNAIFDEMAPSYGYDIVSTGPARLKYNLLERHVRPGDRVLDVGCGNGIHMHVLAPLCREIVGVDINTPMLELARAKFAEIGIGNAVLHQTSAEALPFDDASFDLVYSFSTLLLVPDLARALDELVRVLRPGGVAVLDLAGHWNLSRRHRSRFYQKVGHFGINSFTWSAARQTLEARGLELLESHALGLTDQWRCLPFIHRFAWLDRLFHDGSTYDRDYRLSNWGIFRPLANRWYIVARKASGERPGC